MKNHFIILALIIFTGLGISSCLKKPEAEIYCNDKTASPDEVISFSLKYKHAKNFIVDFGDGTSTDEEKYSGVSHSYSETGNYEVTLTAYNRKIENGDSYSINLTIKENETGTFTDARDGQIYKTVIIEDRMWMAENFNYDSGVGCWDYNNDTTNSIIYGKLYDWETANSSAPPGWHLPTKDEWDKLIRSYGGQNFAGGKLKATGTSLWLSPNLGATNGSSFSALPGGYNIGHSSKLGINGTFWTSDEEDTEYSEVYILYNDNERIDSSSFPKDWGCSVRYIKDEVFIN